MLVKVSARLGWLMGVPPGEWEVKVSWQGVELTHTPQTVINQRQREADEAARKLRDQMARDAHQRQQDMNQRMRDRDSGWWQEVRSDLMDPLSYVSASTEGLTAVGGSGRFQDAVIHQQGEQQMLYQSRTTPGLNFKADGDRKVWDKGVTPVGMLDARGKDPDPVHVHIRVMMWAIVGYARAQQWSSSAIVITSLLRKGDSGVHGVGRGFDLRMAEDFQAQSRGVFGGLSLRQAKELDDYVGRVFPPYRGWNETKYHDSFIVKPHGSAPHVHGQCAAAVGYVSRNTHQDHHGTNPGTTEETVVQQPGTETAGEGGAPGGVA